MTPERYLEVQFIKHIRKGYVTNAELSRQGTSVLLPHMSPGEHCIVTVHDKQKRQLWFTNRRLLLQAQSRVTALFEYEAVSHVHWMFKELWDRLRTMNNRVVTHPASAPEWELRLPPIRINNEEVCVDHCGSMTALFVPTTHLDLLSRMAGCSMDQQCILNLAWKSAPGTAR